MRIPVYKKKFVCMSQNEAAHEALKDLAFAKDGPSCVAITGPRWSGKSTLIHECAESIEEKDPSLVFVCTGADIAMAISMDADDSFFERLGSSSVLIVDNYDLLLRSESGPQMTKLMLEERSKNGGRTVVVLNEDLEQCCSEDSLGEMRAVFARFAFFDLVPLDAAGRRGYVRWMEDVYRCDASPALDDGAVCFLAERSDSTFRDIENEVAFLMTGTDLEPGALVDESLARRLLEE